jgi:hypothetical protein
VSVPVGSVIVPLLEIEAITGSVSVLLVKVSVVARPTSVSVPVGIVIVPLLDIDAITGSVSVLFVSVWVSVVPTMTPEGAALPESAIVVPAVPFHETRLPFVELPGPFTVPDPARASGLHEAGELEGLAPVLVAIAI